MLPIRSSKKCAKGTTKNSTAASPAAVSRSMVTSFASPERAFATTSHFVTPVLDQTETFSRTSPPVLSPSVHLIHPRFDCQAKSVEPFQLISFSEARDLKASNPLVRINSQSCSKCFCFICNQPVQNCKEWETSHCHAHDKDELWQSLKQSKEIPQDPSSLKPPVSVLQDQKKVTVNILKAILRRNKQHVSGKKQILLDRIADGELYGQLTSCPECSHGRLKISEDATNMVFCHGYYEGDTFRPCNFSCLAEAAPRHEEWLYNGYSDEQKGDAMAKSAAVTKAKRVETYAKLLEGNEKLKVPQLKNILRRNGQHVTGAKRQLLARLVDGRQYGRLDYCPLCKVGRLKVRTDENDVSLVFCPGHWDNYAYHAVPCSYSSPAEDAPRVGPWLEK